MERFQKIMNDINCSTKSIRTFPFDSSVKMKITEKYEINPESLLREFLENTGGIIIDNWMRIYGAGEVDFVSRNALFPFDNIMSVSEKNELAHSASGECRS